MDFVEHLRRQLGFLERSCASCDAGYRDEAIRIATIIRVLIHNTKVSTSLLKHLNAMTINLLSTTTEPPPQTLFFTGLGMMRIGSGKSEYFPQLGDGPPISSFVPASKWWDQVVMVLDGHRISRRDIVLAAISKDGGAHVDARSVQSMKYLLRTGRLGHLSTIPKVPGRKRQSRTLISSLSDSSDTRYSTLRNSKNLQKEPNRVAGGFSPSALTPPGMRVRTGRFTEITGP